MNCLCGECRNIGIVQDRATLSCNAVVDGGSFGDGWALNFQGMYVAALDQPLGQGAHYLPRDIILYIADFAADESVPIALAEEQAAALDSTSPGVRVSVRAAERLYSWVNSRLGEVFVDHANELSWYFTRIGRLSWSIELEFPCSILHRHNSDSDRGNEDGDARIIDHRASPPRRRLSLVAWWCWARRCWAVERRDGPLAFARSLRLATPLAQGLDRLANRVPHPPSPPICKTNTLREIRSPPLFSEI